MGDGDSYRSSEEFLDTMAKVRQQRSEEVAKTLFLLADAFQNVRPSTKQQIVGITVTPQLRDALLSTMDRRFIDVVLDKEGKRREKICGIYLDTEE